MPRENARAAKPVCSAGWPTDLVAWYRLNRRRLPWREHPTAYRVWISEVMLQQTRVETVVEYFRRFTQRFPGVAELAAADLQDVLKAWEGLGYYRRARNLHAAAGVITTERAGVIPGSYRELLTLPGVGEYTAAAIASIAFCEPVPAVDGNVLRVAARFWALSEDIAKARTRRLVSARLLPAVKAVSPADFNQAMMELGATVCRVRSPSCAACPLASGCTAWREGRTGELPVRRRRRAVPHYQIAVGVITDGGKVLVCRRREDQMLGGLWEFPGGKQQAGESLEETVGREVLEEVDLVVRVTGKLCSLEHAYSHFSISLAAFTCVVVSGRPQALSADVVRWVPARRLRDLPFPRANQRILEAMARVGLLPE